MTIPTDISRAAADRDAQEAGEGRERLREAKDEVMTAAVRYAIGDYPEANDAALVQLGQIVEEKVEKYVRVLVGDGHTMTEDERRAAWLLGLVGEE